MNARHRRAVGTRPEASGRRNFRWTCWTDPDPCRVLEAVLSISSDTGARWHMLPQSYPNYKTVHRRFQIGLSSTPVTSRKPKYLTKKQISAAADTNSRRSSIMTN